jgi:hypothetical protein
MNDAFNMRACGWCFLLLGLALLGWAAAFDIAVETGPSWDRTAIINQGLVSHRTVITAAGATFSVVGAILIGAGSVIATLAAIHAATRAPAPPETLSHQAPAGDRATEEQPVPLRSGEADDQAFIVAISVISFLVVAGLAWLAIAGA